MLITIYIEVMENGQITGQGSSPFSDKCVEICIEEDHPILLYGFGRYSYIDGKIIEDLSNLLIEMKKEKDEELNRACRDSILSGFNHTVNGSLYHFAFDTEAQFNFQGADRLLNSDAVEEIMWTVQKDGEYLRIPINKIIINELALVILQHKDRNISKYRDLLVPLLNSAKTIEEIKLISWDRNIRQE